MKAVQTQALKGYDASATVESMRVTIVSIAYRFGKSGNTGLLRPLASFAGVAGFINAHKKVAKVFEVPTLLPDNMDGFALTDDQKRNKKRFAKKYLSGSDESEAMQAIYDWLFPEPKQSQPKEKTQVQVWKAALKKLESLDLDTLPTDAHLPIQDAIAALEADIDQAEALAAALKSAK